LWRTSNTGRDLSGSGTTVLPALLAVLWPKCPLCLAAYGGVLGVLGIGPILRSTWAKIVLLVIIAGFRCAGLLRTSRARFLGPLVLSLAAVTALAVSLLAYPSTPIAASGLMLLAGSVVLERSPTGRVVDPAVASSYSCPHHAS